MRYYAVVFLCVTLLLLSLLTSCKGTDGRNDSMSMRDETSLSQQSESLSKESLSLSQEEESDSIPAIEGLVTTDSQLLPVQFPEQFHWATEEELEAFSDFLSDLTSLKIETLIGVSSPSSQEISCALTTQQVEEILEKLTLLQPAVYSEPENPTTGGALTLSIQTEDQIHLIGFNGNWITWYQDGQTEYEIMDASPCEKTGYEIWDILEQALNAAEAEK